MFEKSAPILVIDYMLSATSPTQQHSRTKQRKARRPKSYRRGWYLSGERSSNMKKHGVYDDRMWRP